MRLQLLLTQLQVPALNIYTLLLHKLRIEFCKCFFWQVNFDFSFYFAFPDPFPPEYFLVREDVTAQHTNTTFSDREAEDERDDEPLNGNTPQITFQVKS